MSEPNPTAKRDEPSIERDDVDDVIAHAEQLRIEDERDLSLEDVKAVGRELDIEPAYIEKAVAKRETEKREQAAAEAALRVERQKQLALARKVGLGGAVAVVLGCLVIWLGAQSRASELRSLDAEVARARAQLVSVTERQARVETEYRPRSPSPDRDAELLGAENRVRVERSRYDEAAAAYNAARGRSFGGWAARLYDVPARAPLSNEVIK